MNNYPASRPKLEYSSDEIKTSSSLSSSDEKANECTRHVINLKESKTHVFYLITSEDENSEHTSSLLRIKISKRKPQYRKLATENSFSRGDNDREMTDNSQLNIRKAKSSLPSIRKRSDHPSFVVLPEVLKRGSVTKESIDRNQSTSDNSNETYVIRSRKGNTLLKNKSNIPVCIGALLTKNNGKTMNPTYLRGLVCKSPVEGNSEDYCECNTDAFGKCSDKIERGSDITGLNKMKSEPKFSARNTSPFISKNQNSDELFNIKYVESTETEPSQRLRAGQDRESRYKSCHLCPNMKRIFPPTSAKPRNPAESSYSEAASNLNRPDRSGYVDINYKLVRQCLIYGSTFDKCEVLDAIRLRIQSPDSDVAMNTMHDIVKFDLFGVQCECRSKPLLEELFWPINVATPSSLQTSIARFVNAMVSHKIGRDYFNGRSIIHLLTWGDIGRDNIDTTMGDNLMGIMMKLSFTRYQCSDMIQNGLLHWLLAHMEEVEYSCSKYHLECMTKLLRNLLRSDEMNDISSKDIQKLILLLGRFLDTDNDAAKGYICESLLSLCQKRETVASAKILNFRKIIEEHLKKAVNAKHKEHLQAVYQLLNSSRMSKSFSNGKFDHQTEQKAYLDNDIELFDEEIDYYSGENLLREKFSGNEKDTCDKKDFNKFTPVVSNEPLKDGKLISRVFVEPLNCFLPTIEKNRIFPLGKSIYVDKVCSHLGETQPKKRQPYIPPNSRISGFPRQLRKQESKGMPNTYVGDVSKSVILQAKLFDNQISEKSKHFVATISTISHDISAPKWDNFQKNVKNASETLVANKVKGRKCAKTTDDIGAYSLEGKNSTVNSAIKDLDNALLNDPIQEEIIQKISYCIEPSSADLSEGKSVHDDQESPISVVEEQVTLIQAVTSLIIQDMHHATTDKNDNQISTEARTDECNILCGTANENTVIKSEDSCNVDKDYVLQQKQPDKLIVIPDEQADKVSLLPDATDKNSIKQSAEESNRVDKENELQDKQPDKLFTQSDAPEFKADKDTLPSSPTHQSNELQPKQSDKFITKTSKHTTGMKNPHQPSQKSMCTMNDVYTDRRLSTSGSIDTSVRNAKDLVRVNSARKFVDVSEENLTLGKTGSLPDLTVVRKQTDEQATELRVVGHPKETSKHLVRVHESTADQDLSTNDKVFGSRANYQESTRGNLDDSTKHPDPIEIINVSNSHLLLNARSEENLRPNKNLNLRTTSSSVLELNKDLNTNSNDLLLNARSNELLRPKRNRIIETNQQLHAGSEMLFDQSCSLREAQMLNDALTKRSELAQNATLVSNEVTTVRTSQQLLEPKEMFQVEIPILASVDVKENIGERVISTRGNVQIGSSSNEALQHDIMFEKKINEQLTDSLALKDMLKAKIKTDEETLDKSVLESERIGRHVESNNQNLNARSIEIAEQSVIRRKDGSSSMSEVLAPDVISEYSSSSSLKKSKDCVDCEGSGYVLRARASQPCDNCKASLTKYPNFVQALNNEVFTLENDQQRIVTQTSAENIKVTWTSESNEISNVNRNEGKTNEEDDKVLKKGGKMTTIKSTQNVEKTLKETGRQLSTTSSKKISSPVKDSVTYIEISKNETNIRGIKETILTTSMKKFQSKSASNLATEPSVDPMQSKNKNKCKSDERLSRSYEKQAVAVKKSEEKQPTFISSEKSKVRVLKNVRKSKAVVTSVKSDYILPARSIEKVKDEPIAQSSSYIPLSKTDSVCSLRTDTETKKSKKEEFKEVTVTKKVSGQDIRKPTNKSIKSFETTVELGNHGKVTSEYDMQGKNETLSMKHSDQNLGNKNEIHSSSPEHIQNLTPEITKEATINRPIVSCEEFLNVKHQSDLNDGMAMSKEIKTNELTVSALLETSINPLCQRSIEPSGHDSMDETKSNITQSPTLAKSDHFLLARSLEIVNDSIKPILMMKQRSEGFSEVPANEMADAVKARISQISYNPAAKNSGHSLDETVIGATVISTNIIKDEHLCSNVVELPVETLDPTNLMTSVNESDSRSELLNNQQQNSDIKSEKGYSHLLHRTQTMSPKASEKWIDDKVAGSKSDIALLEKAKEETIENEPSDHFLYFRSKRLENQKSNRSTSNPADLGDGKIENEKIDLSVSSSNKFLDEKTAGLASGHQVSIANEVELRQHTVGKAQSESLIGSEEGNHLKFARSMEITTDKGTIAVKQKIKDRQQTLLERKSENILGGLINESEPLSINDTLTAKPITTENSNENEIGKTTERTQSSKEETIVSLKGDGNDSVNLVTELNLPTMVKSHSKTSLKSLKIENPEKDQDLSGSKNRSREEADDVLRSSKNLSSNFPKKVSRPKSSSFTSSFSAKGSGRNTIKVDSSYQSPPSKCLGGLSFDLTVSKSGRNKRLSFGNQVSQPPKIVENIMGETVISADNGDQCMQATSVRKSIAIVPEEDVKISKSKEQIIAIENEAISFGETLIDKTVVNPTPEPILARETLCEASNRNDILFARSVEIITAQQDADILRTDTFQMGKVGLRNTEQLQKSTKTVEVITDASNNPAISIHDESNLLNASNTSNVKIKSKSDDRLTEKLKRSTKICKEQVEVSSIENSRRMSNDSENRSTKESPIKIYRRNSVPRIFKSDEDVLSDKHNQRFPTEELLVEEKTKVNITESSEPVCHIETQNSLEIKEPLKDDTLETDYNLVPHSCNEDVVSRPLSDHQSVIISLSKLKDPTDASSQLEKKSSEIATYSLNSDDPVQHSSTIISNLDNNQQSSKYSKRKVPVGTFGSTNRVKHETEGEQHVSVSSEKKLQLGVGNVLSDENLSRNFTKRLQIQSNTPEINDDKKRADFLEVLMDDANVNRIIDNPLSTSRQLPQIDSSVIVCKKEQEFSGQLLAARSLEVDYGMNARPKSWQHYSSTSVEKSMAGKSNLLLARSLVPMISERDSRKSQREHDSMPLRDENSSAGVKKNDATTLLADVGISRISTEQAASRNFLLPRSVENVQRLSRRKPDEDAKTKQLLSNKLIEIIKEESVASHGSEKHLPVTSTRKEDSRKHGSKISVASDEVLLEERIYSEDDGACSTRTRHQFSDDNIGCVNVEKGSKEKRKPRATNANYRRILLNDDELINSISEKVIAKLFPQLQNCGSNCKSPCGGLNPYYKSTKDNNQNSE